VHRDQPPVSSLGKQQQLGPNSQGRCGVLPADNKVTPSAVMTHLDFPFFALFMSLGAVLAVEVLFGPLRWPMGDNTWLFRWALDVVRERPIFWSGVDANRTFPDLLFSLIAALLPEGEKYNRWLDYYYAIFTFSTWAALLLLATVLYPERERRFAFVSVASASLVGIAVLLPFWDSEIMLPGNHGGSIPLVLIVFSILLLDVRQNRYRYLLFSAYILLCAGLVMANRYLALVVIVPLFICALLLKRSCVEKVLASASTLFAALLGFLALHELNSSRFFHLVAPGHHPSFGDASSISWWVSRPYKELHQIVSATDGAQLLAGLVIIAFAIAYGTFRLFSSRRAGKMEGETALATFASASGIISLLFILIMVDDSGDWHYRYLTVALTISTFLMAAAAITRPSGIQIVYLIAPLVMLLPASYMLLSSSTSYAIDYERSFREDIDHLSSVLMLHDHRAAHVGLTHYWIANEVTARAPNIQLLSVVGSGLVYWPYNNNSAELCHINVSFILVQPSIGEPRVDPLVFPPQSSTSLKLGRFGIVNLLFFDDGFLDDRIVRPARAAARREFSSFNCKR
jgi:hypothetical protein